MATFGAATFIEQGDGSGNALSFRSSVTGRRHRIPGSNRVIVHRNSAAVHSLETEVRCTGAELAALRAKVGSVDMLTLSKTVGSALLMSVSPERVFEYDVYRVSLNFRYYGSFTVPGVGGYGQNYGSDYGA